MKFTLGWLFLFFCISVNPLYAYGESRLPDQYQNTISIILPILAKIRIDIPKESTSQQLQKLSSNDSRLIIKNADISSEVIDVEDVVLRLNDIVNKKRGIIVSTKIIRGEPIGKSAEVVIRIPSGNYNTMVNEIIGVSSEVLAKSIRGSDVTEEYEAIHSQIESKKKIESRYMKLLSSLKIIQDILAVEKYLVDVRMEIENLQEKQKQLTDKLELLTINVFLHQKKPIVIKKNEGIGEKLSTSLNNGILGMIDVLGKGITFLISYAPIIIIISIVAFLYYMRKKKKSPKVS